MMPKPMPSTSTAPVAKVAPRIDPERTEEAARLKFIHEFFSLVSSFVTSDSIAASFDDDNEDDHSSISSSSLWSSSKSSSSSDNDSDDENYPPAKRIKK